MANSVAAGGSLTLEHHARLPAGNLNDQEYFGTGEEAHNDFVGHMTQLLWAVVVIIPFHYNV